MMVITSLLQLQSKGIKEKQYREMFSDSVNRINTMAIIHEKLYRSKDMSNVNFDDYLKSMLNSMLLSYRSDSLKIELKTDVDNVSLGVNTAIPCGLIINELISNSLKHAFPEGNEGEIRVAMFTNDKAEIELTVSDNGVGIPENLDFRDTDSLGLTIVNALTAQLRGTIDLNREKGTRFVITFKG
jgi:two-component sensor histidine kinase